jgi:prepilin-type N-terminal cleavage/methylation domain-containing protein
MTRQIRARGVTLIELLVVIAILSLVLAGVYGMLNAAYQSYLNNRRRIDSQQTARSSMDYLVFRLREIEGGPMTDQPWDCTHCHRADVDGNGMNGDGKGNDDYVCPRDVSIPRRSLYIDTLKTVPLPQLASLPSTYQNMTGNFITFEADLLPLVGFCEGFTDKDGDGVWDWIAKNPASDKNANGLYDWPEPELLEDSNENSQQDCFAETWTLQLRSSGSGKYYELVESLDFNSLKPTVSSTKPYNKSVYPTTGTGYPAFISYTSQIVAYGLVGMSIQKVPRITNPTVHPNQEVVSACYDETNPTTGCHGSSAGTGTTNVYGNGKDFDYTPFLATHPWWNVRGLSVEVATASTNVQKEYFLKLKQFVIPRNLEINQ